MSKSQQILGLIFLLAICLGVGVLGAIATTPEIDGWYRTLQKPSWNPPDWIFGPVWSTLYVLMAVAAWLVWRRGGFKAAKLPLVLFGLQLVLNTAWSWIFFHFHQPGWAFVELIGLWVTVAAVTVAFFRVNKTAGFLLIPYLAWITFAGVLNLTIWRMNS